MKKLVEASKKLGWPGSVTDLCLQNSILYAYHFLVYLSFLLRSPSHFNHLIPLLPDSLISPSSSIGTHEVSPE